jgi:hypothetical protein
MTERRRALVLAGACAVLAALVFRRAMMFPFLNWDDNLNFLSGSGQSGLSFIFTSTLGNWMPLTKLVVLFERAAWGVNPIGYHLTNIVLHAVNTALVYLLARRLFRSTARDVSTEVEIAAVFSALFWALHPLRVESVAWSSTQNYLISTLLALASTLAYVRGAQEGENGRGDAQRRIALGLGAAAMTAKMFTAVLPAVFLVLDARLRGRARWKEKWPWIIPAAAVFGFSLAAQRRTGGAVSWLNFGLRARLAQAAYGLSFYPLKTLSPFGLSPLYERSILLEPLPFIFGAAASLLGFIVVRRMRGRCPALAQGALAYFLLVFPALGLFKTGRMTVADRYSYLSGIPLALLAGAVVARSAGRKGPVLASVALLALLAALTLGQLPVWSSDVSLWTRGCEISPLSYFARLQLAAADKAAGRAAAAAADRAEAERLHSEVFSRAATIYAARGDQAAAAAALAREKDGLAAFSAPAP